jgi:hypothetical protein
MISAITKKHLNALHSIYMKTSNSQHIAAILTDPINHLNQLIESDKPSDIVGYRIYNKHKLSNSLLDYQATKLF